jgi:hypothetical protein
MVDSDPGQDVRLKNFTPQRLVKTARGVLVACALSLLSACATKHAYWGEPRPPSETALIRGTYVQALFWSVRCGVLSVDGVE